MKVLFVSANSRSEYLDIEREHRILLDLLVSAEHSLRVLPAAGVADLREALRANRKSRDFDVLHFCGHASKEHGLHLRGRGHRPAYFSSKMLKKYLIGSNVRLAVLNACDSEALAVSLSKVIPGAIGTTRVVRDLAARQFSRDFYSALISNSSVHTAFEHALKKQRPCSTPAYILASQELSVADRRISK